MAKKRFSVQVIIASFSCISMCVVLIYLLKGLSQSGFGTYLSLVFSDAAVLRVYWQELMFSLVESMPFLGVAAFLSALALFIWSSTKAIKDGRRMMIQVR